MAFRTTGTLTAAAQTVSNVNNPIGSDNLAIVGLNGTYGGASVVFEVTRDATTWYGLQANRQNTPSVDTSTVSISDNSTTSWKLDITGWNLVRVRCIGISSGTINVEINTSSQPFPLAVNNITVTNGGAQTVTTLTLSGLLTELAADALTAVGTTQGTALALTAQINKVSTAANATAPFNGVKLMASAAGLEIDVTNISGNPIQVYGLGTDTINAVSSATGITVMPNSTVTFFCTAAGTWQTMSAGTGYAGSLETAFTIGGLTAVGGGQGGALLLPAAVNRFTTVGAGNGCVLPVNAVGLSVAVTNDGANALNVFPDSGAAINSLATNAATPLPVGQTAFFYCVAANVWKTQIFSPRSVSGTLTTNGAGTILAATIVGGEVTRTGLTAAQTDTTDTAALIIAALHGAAVGQSWEFTYINNTAFLVTLAGGGSVTLSELASNTSTCPSNSWVRFLVTVATASTVKMEEIAAGPNSYLLPAKFTTAALSAGTLAAGQASGALYTVLANTGATPGTQNLRTVAQTLLDTPGIAVGVSYVLRIINNGTSSLTLATDGSSQFTMTGNMITLLNTYSDYIVSITGATAGTVQFVGGGPASQPLPFAKFTTMSVATGTLAAGQASGAIITSLTSTGATPGNQLMRTPALVLTDTPGLAVGQSYLLRITQTGAGTLTLATDSGAGFTMTGTMTVAQNTTRDFIVTMNSGTTGTVQSVSVGSFS